MNTGFSALDGPFTPEMLDDPDDLNALNALNALNDRRYLVLGYTMLGGLFVLAWWYYLERTCFLDSAYILVNTLMSDSKALTPGRYSAILTQWPVTIAAWFGLPLKGLLLVYSLTFIVWPAIVYGIIVHRLRQPALGLALVLASTVMLSDGFYWIPSQIQQGIWWAMLFGAVLFRSDERPLSPMSKAAAAALTALMLFTHPVSIIPWMFLYGYWLIVRRPRPDMFVRLLPALTVAAWIARMLVVRLTYDIQRFESLSNFRKIFPDYFTIASHSIFLRYALTDYFFALLMLGLCLLLYLGRRQWLRMGWLLGFFFGYLLLINVSLPGGAARFYLELQYQPLALFIAVPFALEVLPALINRRAAILFVAVICVVRLGMIVAHDDLYTARLDWQKGLIERLRGEEGNRFLIAERDVHIDRLIMTWGTGFESLLLSSALDPARPITFVVDENPDRFDRDRDDLYQTEWDVWPASALPQKYFPLAPARYRVIKP